MTSSVQGRILVVDGDGQARRSVTAVLRARGYLAMEATNGKEARDLLIAERRDEPSLILLELELPTMSGWEFVAITKSYLRLSQIPIVVIGDAPPSELLRHGTIAGFLSKPVQEDALLEVVERHIHRP